jgi:predicted kinase
LCAADRAEITVCYFETSEMEAARRKAARERPVPARALDRMLDHWEPPDLTECHALDVRIT